MWSRGAREHLYDFLRTGVVGAANSVLGYAAIFGLMLLGVGPFVSNFVGYLAGWVLAFVLYRGWVFRSRQAATGVTFRYVTAVALAFLANVIILWLLLEIGFHKWLAQIGSGIVYTLIMYLTSSFWVFRNQ